MSALQKGASCGVAVARMTVLALVALGSGVTVAGMGVTVLVVLGVGVAVLVGTVVAVGEGVSVSGHCIVTVGKIQAMIIPTKNRLIGTIG